MKPEITSAIRGQGSSSLLALKIQGVSHQFGNHRALHSTSFEVEERSIHGFVGANGAGKTTTLKLIATLDSIQAGSIEVFGRCVRKAPLSVRAIIGFMPDHFSMYRTMRVAEYLDFFAAAYGLPRHKREDVIAGVLALTDMDVRSNDRIKGLSRGMQQRLSLARVLINDPRLLLLDEPASGLDPRARIELMMILKELKKMGKTIFISSHILSELADLCDSVTLIDRGNIRYTGSMEGLLTDDDEIASFRVRLAPPSESEEPTPSSTEGILQTITKLEGIDEAELTETGDILIRTQREVYSAQRLLTTLVTAQLPIVSFQEETRQLNQAFMDLTEPGVRE